jgi:NADH:ubiquinone oxidoreductase subunit D
VGVSLDPLHGTKKLIEYKNYTQALSCFARLDYVLLQALSLEKLLRCIAPLRPQFIHAPFAAIAWMHPRLSMGQVNTSIFTCS